MKDTFASELMLEFAAATGLSTSVAPRRYLWTDAFAVCNFLCLAKMTREQRFLDLAVKLVDQVHHVLGRHRSDDSRSGWISGLSDGEGERHPTRGGLRIGKTLNERPSDQPYDPEQEWDRDGQYLHYLTKWIHALYRMAEDTGQTQYFQSAKELAATACRAFIFQPYPGGAKRMVWKMSIDLHRALVPSMGHHDPLDGLVTCLELNDSLAGSAECEPDLRPAIIDLTALCDGADWTTDDSLGIGGLLDAAARLLQILIHQGIDRSELLRHVLLDAITSLQSVNWRRLLSQPADYRLAFRELGFSIGLHQIEHVKELANHDSRLVPLIEQILAFESLAIQIEDFWSQSENRRGSTWNDHHDINSVMLATCLIPGGYAPQPSTHEAGTSRFSCQ